MAKPIPFKKPQAQAPIKSKLVLENSALLSLRKNNQLLEAFPFLKALPTAESMRGCGSCSSAKRAAKVEQTATLNRVKQQIRGMADDKKQLFKSILNVSSIRIYFQQGRSIVGVDI